MDTRAPDLAPRMAAIAREAASSYPSGCAFVDLVPVAEFQLTSETIRRFRTGYVEAFGAATDDPLYGQNVGLAVAISENGDRTVRELYHWMRARLTEAKLPVRWWVLDAIPRSDRGKLSREAVREACAGRAPLELAHILQAPRAT